MQGLTAKGTPTFKGFVAEMKVVLIAFGGRVHSSVFCLGLEGSLFTKSHASCWMQQFSQRIIPWLSR